VPGGKKLTSEELEGMAASNKAKADQLEESAQRLRELIAAKERESRYKVDMYDRGVMEMEAGRFRSEVAEEQLARMADRNGGINEAIEAEPEVAY